MMTFNDVFVLLLLSLATLYHAHAISKTHGAFGMFAWVRKHLPLGGLTACPICLAFWLALVFYLLWLVPPLQPVVVISAIAGGADAIGFFTGAWHQPSRPPT